MHDQFALVHTGFIETLQITINTGNHHQRKVTKILARAHLIADPLFYYPDIHEVSGISKSKSIFPCTQHQAVFSEIKTIDCHHLSGDMVLILRTHLKIEISPYAG